MTTRVQLTTATVAVLLVANALLSLAAVIYLEGVWIEEVQRRVRLDLNSARTAYNGHIRAIDRYLAAAALNGGLVDALASGDRDRLQATVEPLFSRGDIDFLTVLDPQGQVVARGRSTRRLGDDLSGVSVVAAAMAGQQNVSGSMILTREQLLAEGEDLAELARFELVDTPAAKPTQETERTAGMAVGAAVPVRDARGRVLGYLFGGDLLNRRFEIVDSIRDDVFPRTLEGEAVVGNVTIFQGDLRIATNVFLENRQRAVGTRLSAAVYDQIFGKGEPWLGPAFVVSDWYITAYEPIRNPRGEVIGALYVGLLEEPFAHRRRVIIGVFLAMVVVATLASLALMSLATNFILRPVSRVVEMSRRVVEGDLTARVGIRPPGEMGVLCQAVDSMADAVAQREDRIKTATRQQITRSEQLAAVGRLAAGVAHEINNPLTGVLTFACLLREKPNLDDQDRADLDLIIHETSRAAEIVKSLLDFARERPPQKEPLSMNEVVRRTLRLIQNQKLMRQIEIREEFAEDLPVIEGDMNQLQQVVLNLSLNACEAMPTGGRLTITTTPHDGGVMVRVADTGTGIRREDLNRIFEPFFSTKPVGKGTGLGLSVSYGIVQQHGGTIEVDSTPGQGSTFTIVLPPTSENGAPTGTAREATNATEQT
ncbi:MAG: cache domain-containing protein [Planctomycetota bacterium]